MILITGDTHEQLDNAMNSVFKELPSDEEYAEALANLEKSGHYHLNYMSDIYPGFEVLYSKMFEIL